MSALVFYTCERSTRSDKYDPSRDDSKSGGSAALTNPAVGDDLALQENGVK